MSRVAGLVREIVAAAIFGTSGAISAFVVAFNVPNLLRSLVADSALSAAFVPVFTAAPGAGPPPRGPAPGGRVLRPDLDRRSA